MQQFIDFVPEVFEHLKRQGYTNYIYCEYTGMPEIFPLLNKGIAGQLQQLILLFPFNTFPRAAARQTHIPGSTIINTHEHAIEQLAIEHKQRKVMIGLEAKMLENYCSRQKRKGNV